MEAKIIDKEQIILFGFSFFGDPFNKHDCWTDDNEIGRLWKRFMTYLKQNKDKIKNIKSEEHLYEVYSIVNEITCERPRSGGRQRRNRPGGRCGLLRKYRHTRKG